MTPVPFSFFTDLTWSGATGPYGGSYGGGYGGTYSGYFDRFSWTYDSDSRVATLALPYHTSEGLSYSYDHDSQLTNTSAYGGSYGGASYSWNANGDPNGSGVIIGQGNRLLYDGTYKYTYDADGNLLSRASSSAETDYVWDNRNQLVSVKDYVISAGTLYQTQQVDYEYDMFGQIIGRTLTPYTYGTIGTPVVLRFVYDGGNMVLAFNGSEALTDRYLWGPAVDQILADEQFTPTTSGQMPTTAGMTLWTLTDNQGTIRDLVSTSYLYDHVSIDAFGKRLWETNSSTSERVGYTGSFYDLATGLVHDGARWYNPAIQRWLSPDPSGLGPDSNPYRYVGNSPTNFTDPTGLNLFDDWGGVAAPNPITARSTPQTAEQQAALNRQMRRLYAGMNGEGPLTAGSTIGVGDGQYETLQMMENITAAVYGGMANLSHGLTNLYTAGPKAICALPGQIAEFGKMATDEVNALTYILTGHEFYHGDWSKAGQDLESGRVTLGQYYLGVAEGPVNTLTLGFYGEAKAFYQYAIGDISADQMQQTVFSTATFQAFTLMALQSGANTCFPAGTFVAAIRGLVPIESIEVGEEVWAFDLITSQWRACRVVKRFRPEHKGSLVAITVAGETIESTFHHPYWVVCGDDLEDRPRGIHLAGVPEGATTPGRWVDAVDLRVGDHLLLRDGRMASVETFQHRPFLGTVYNFQIDQLECYAVGRNNLLVHNGNNDGLENAPNEPIQDPENDVAALQRFEQIAKHRPGGFGSPAILSDADAGLAVNQAASIKPGMRAIQLQDGRVAVFRSASKKPGTFGSDLWHGGWEANPAEMSEIGNAPLPTFHPGN